MKAKNITFFTAITILFLACFSFAIFNVSTYGEKATLVTVGALIVTFFLLFGASVTFAKYESKLETLAKKLKTPIGVNALATVLVILFCIALGWISAPIWAFSIPGAVIGAQYFFFALNH